MRHIVEYDAETMRWAVVDTESAHLVISLHATVGAAQSAAATEEHDWPSRNPMVLVRAA